MDKPGVGIAILVYNIYGEILIGQRVGAHGAGLWSIPGGGVELNETSREAACRELQEETRLGRRPHELTHAGVGESIWIDKDKGQQHWFTIVYEVDCYNDEHPFNAEPTKCAGWEWVDPRDLERKYQLFQPLKSYLVVRPVASWPIRTTRTRSMR